LPSSKSISDITVKPQALFYYCTYRNFTVFCSKKILKAQNARNTITKMLVQSIALPIGTLRFSAQNTILKARNARKTINKMLVQSKIPIKCGVAKF
jgi:hypothetical protein